MDNLLITLASFDKAMDLQDAVGKAVKESKINLEGDVLEKELDSTSLMGFINAFISVGISKDVKTALFKCAETCLYNNSKVDKDFFEKTENRELFYPIMIEIAKANLAPFLKGLTSLFGTSFTGKIENILK